MTGFVGGIGHTEVKFFIPWLARRQRLPRSLHPWILGWQYPDDYTKSSWTQNSCNAHRNALREFVYASVLGVRPRVCSPFTLDCSIHTYNPESDIAYPIRFHRFLARTVRSRCMWWITFALWKLFATRKRVKTRGNLLETVLQNRWLV